MKDNKQVILFLENNKQRIYNIASKYFIEGKEELQHNNLYSFLSDLENETKEYNFTSAFNQITSSVIPFDVLMNSLKKWAKSTQNKYSKRNKSFLNLSQNHVSSNRFGNAKHLNIDPVEENLRSAIIRYESLVKLQKEQHIDTRFSSKVLSLIRKQLGLHLEGKAKKLPVISKRAIPSIKERRMNGLKRIFEFYCKQQPSLTKKSTFEWIPINTINISGFIKFCKDFTIPLSITQLRIIFKGKPYHGRNLGWQQFIVKY